MNTWLFEYLVYLLNFFGGVFAIYAIIKVFRLLKLKGDEQIYLSNRAQGSAWIAAVFFVAAQIIKSTFL